MKPSAMYVFQLRDCYMMKSAACVTDSGLKGAIEHILPPHLSAEINVKSWNIPPVFGWIQSKAKLTAENLVEKFNFGIGLVAVFPKEATDWNQIGGEIGEYYHNRLF